MRPLGRLEAAAREAHQEQQTTWETEQAASKIRRVAAQQAAVKNAKKGETFDVAQLIAGESDEPPRARRFITNDTTVEALGEILIASPNGVLAFRDELAGLLKNLEREGQEAARAFYLSAWTGKESHVFDRIGRGLDRHIDACCVSLLGSIQPAIIGSYLREAASVSGDDGLMSRFQLLVWPDISGEWRNVDRWPDSDARREAFALFKALDEAKPEELGATIEEGALPYVRFDRAAQAVFNDWREELENRIRSDDEHPALVAHLSKYRGLVPRLSLVLHLVDKQKGPIGKETLLRALSWAEYLETHARRAYASVTRARAEAAKALLAKLRRGDLPTPFKARDVYQKDWALLSEPDQVHRAAEYLTEFGYLLPEHPKDRPGRPTVLYHVNPRAMS
jgi:putative DNA primase/helicase